MTTRTAWRGAISALALLFGTGQAVADTLIYLDSEPGDYIGQGIERTLDTTNGTFSATADDRGVHITHSGDSYWRAQFVAPEGERLEPGNYAGAARYPFQGPAQPGLSVTGDGRGCNELTGRFSVLDVARDASGALSRFAANFEQHCEGGEPALVGAVRYNSDLPVEMDALFAAAGPDQRVLEGEPVSLDGSTSSAGSGEITSYRWVQTAGTPVRLIGAEAAAASFYAPLTAMGGEVLSFELTVTRAGGNSASDAVEVTVVDRRDPQTFVRFQSESGDYIGQGRSVDYNLENARFSADRNYDNGVAVRVNGDDSWSLDFAAPGNALLVPAEYDDATRFPFQEATSPGLSVSGAGRGCNTLTGRFTVLEADYDSNEVRSFAADFEQHCGGGDPALFGQVGIDYVNSSLPVADAGIDQVVHEGDAVALDASASRDADGALTYRWTQIGGVPVTLNGSDTAQPRFVAPALGASGEADAHLEFQVWVTDAAGNENVDRVQVNVEPRPATPTADAGTNRTVDSQSSVTLDGSGSSVAGGGSLQYRWTQTSGPAVTLNNPTSASPSFAAPRVKHNQEPRVLRFRLEVTTANGASATDTVEITVRPEPRGPWWWWWRR